jgi:hypothetical protein
VSEPAAEPETPPVPDPVTRVLNDLFAVCEDALTLLALDGEAVSPNLLRALAELRAETLAAFAFLGERQSG